MDAELSVPQQEDVMYDVDSIRREFMAISREIAQCPHMKTCRQECPAGLDTRLPFPGFVGKHYAGLLIVGANPGISDREEFVKGDREHEERLRKIVKSGSMWDYENYLSFVSGYMALWKNHLCNKNFRHDLGYQIEHVAFLNLVKCGSERTGSDVFKNLGKNVAVRCGQRYALRQLSLLKPRYLVAQWKPVITSIHSLGFDISRIETAAYSGQRNLSIQERMREIRPLFKKFTSSSWS